MAHQRNISHLLRIRLHTRRARSVAFFGLALAFFETAAAATAIVDGRRWYYAVENKTAKLVANGKSPCTTAPTGEITVPEKLDGYSVTTISYGAFTNCTKLTKVNLPASVKSLKGAFIGCTALTNVSFAADLITIYDSAFLGCTSLVSFTATSTAASAKVAVEGGVLYSADRKTLWRWPPGLLPVSIPASVTTIHGYALAAVPVSTLRLPGALSGFELNAFAGASSLESFVLSESNETFSVVGGVLYSKDGKNLNACPPARTNLAVCVGTTNVCQYAFTDCKNLTSVTFPRSLTHLAVQSFYTCPALKTITFTGPVPDKWQENGYGGLSTAKAYTFRYNSEYASTWKTALAPFTFSTKVAVSPADLGLGGFTLLFR